MADFRARQRMQIHDGTNEFAVTSGQPIFVSLSDGTDTSLIDGSGNLQVILAANSGVDIGDVDVTSVPAPLNVVGGGTEAAALRVTIANDSTGLVSIDDGGGSITVDGTVSVSGGAVDDAAFTVATDGVTVIGGLADDTTPDSVDEGDQGALRMTLDRKLLTRVVGATDANRLDIDASGNAKAILAANSGVDNGDVDILSIAAGDNNIGNVDIVTVPAPLSTTGGGTEATALRVTIANDSTGLVSIDDGGGSITVDGTVSVSGGATDDAAFTIATDGVTAAGYLADETTPDSVDEGDIGIARMTLDRKQLNVLVDATTDSQRLAIDASGNAAVIAAANSGVDIGDVTINNASGASAVNIQDGGNAITIDGTLTGITNDVNIADGGNSITVDATALDIRTITKATDSIQISKDTAANSETNPIFVKVVTTSTSASEIHNYDTTAAVAKDATDNHDYTVANTTFLLQSVLVAASGAMKVEIQTGPVASLVTQAVIFTSGSKPTEQIVFNPPIEVPATSTGTVRLIRRNDDNQAMDVYSTIIGNDV